MRDMVLCCKEEEGRIDQVLESHFLLGTEAGCHVHTIEPLNLQLCSVFQRFSEPSELFHDTPQICLSYLVALKYCINLFLHML